MAHLKGLQAQIRPGQARQGKARQGQARGMRLGASEGSEGSEWAAAAKAVAKAVAERSRRAVQRGIGLESMRRSDRRVLGEEAANEHLKLGGGW